MLDSFAPAFNDTLDQFCRGTVLKFLQIKLNKEERTDVDNTMYIKTNLTKEQYMRDSFSNFYHLVLI